MIESGSEKGSSRVPGAPPTSSSADGDPLLGAIVDGRFLIERAVGSGGFGTVYRATHLRFDAPVAIKVLRIPSALQEAERRKFIDSFLAEGKLLFNLGALHPSIVRVFEAGTLRGENGLLAPYLAMEWLQGVPLDREIRRRAELELPPLELADALALLGSCVEALTRTHEKSIAHRDIKPGNIFLERHESKVTTKLLDFGLATAANDSVTTSWPSRGGTSAYDGFTPAYAAPEQWLHRLGATGPWTDVYALALVCVELVSGRHPLRGSTRAQLMASCLDEAVRPTPRACGVAVSDLVEAVFRKALAIDPHARYRGVGEFWQALAAAALLSRTALDTSTVRLAVFEGESVAGGPISAGLDHARTTADLEAAVIRSRSSQVGSASRGLLVVFTCVLALQDAASFDTPRRVVEPSGASASSQLVRDTNAGLPVREASEWHTSIAAAPLAGDRAPLPSASGWTPLPAQRGPGERRVARARRLRSATNSALFQLPSAKTPAAPAAESVERIADEAAMRSPDPQAMLNHDALSRRK